MEAKKVGSNLFSMLDVLAPHERMFKAAPTLTNTNKVDIDELNIDIARAAIRLLQRQGQLKIGDGNAKGWEEETRILRVRPPCRFQLFRVQCHGDSFLVLPPSLGIGSEDDPPGLVDVILDVAHNAAAISSLVAKVNAHYPNSPVRYERVCV